MATTLPCEVVSTQIWCSGVGLTYIPILATPPENTTRFLDLSNNRIASVSWELQLYPFLYFLSLANNSLSVVGTDAFRDMFFLEELDLAHNSLTSLSLTAGHFRDLSSLKLLSLHHNVLGPGLNLSVFSHLHTVTCIDLDYNAIIFFHKPSEGKAFLATLTELRLRGNFILNIPSQIWSFVPALVVLDLSENAFRTVPSDSFSTLRHLRTLSLRNVSTLQRVMKGAFANLPHLQHVDISHCGQLTEVQTGSFPAHPPNAITTVNLENNALPRLDESLLPWERLSHLYLAGNPWLCDCRMEWMRHVAAAKKQLSITCSAPDSLKGKDVVTLDAADFRCADRGSQAVIELSPWQVAVLVLTSMVISALLVICLAEAVKRVRMLRKSGTVIRTRLSYGSLHVLQE